MITLSVLDIPSFAMQTTGWKYVRVDRKSSQDLIGSDMKPTVSRHFVQAIFIPTGAL